MICRTGIVFMKVIGKGMIADSKKVLVGARRLRSHEFYWVYDTNWRYYSTARERVQTDSWDNHEPNDSGIPLLELVQVCRAVDISMLLL